MRVYFDNAATTSLIPEVISAMTDAMHHLNGNPSSIHADGRNVRAAVEEARKTVARHIGAGIGEIFFTSGGTESNNMVLKNAVRDLGVQHIISSPIEHHAVLHTLENLQKYQNINVELLSVDEKGRINPAELAEKLAASGKKTLVTLMHSNNEIGTLTDIDAVARICAQHGAYFHSDTVQTMGFYPIDVNKTPIHFLTGSAHKFHGPKGIGFVYINSRVSIKPFIDGGSQERNMRGGTENVHGIIGLGKALDSAYSHIDEHKKQITALRNYFKQQLENIFEDIEFVGDINGEAHYKVLNVSFPPSPRAELLLFLLDMSGISASGGSACSSGAEGGSHVLNALCINPDRKSIRFSFSHLNTQAEVDYTLEKLKSLVALKQPAMSENI